MTTRRTAAERAAAAVGTAINGTPLYVKTNPLTGETEITAGGQQISVGSASANTNFIGGIKLRGRSDYQNSGVDATSYYKVEAEAPFSAVRIWVLQSELSGTQPTYKMAVAPTEDGRGTNVDQMYSPIRGGVSRRALVDVNNVNGYRPVTWGGAATVSPAFPSVVNTATMIASDWIPCASLQRVDSDNGRPCLVAVVEQMTVGATSTVGQSGTPNTLTIQAMRGQAYFREWYETRANYTAGVTDLSLLPSTTAQTTAAAAVFFEFQYNKPARNVLVVGDSTHQGANSEYKLNNFSMMAMLELSTPDSPICFMNIAASAATQYQYKQYLTTLLADDANGITDVILQGFSGNGTSVMGGATAANAELFIQEQMQTLLALRKKGIRVFMTTGFVYGYQLVQDVEWRQRIVAWVRETCANGLAILVDTELLTTDYSTGMGRFKSEYYATDQIHPNALGQRHCADLLKSVWLANN